MRLALLALASLAPALAHAGRDYAAAGPHAVGTTTVVFTKPSETTGLPRPLKTRIWYPSAGQGTVDMPLFDAVVADGRWPLVVFSHGACGIPDQSRFFTTALASWGFVVAAPPHPGNTTGDIPHCFEPAALADSFANRPADVRFVIDQLLAAARDPGSPFFRRLDRRRIGMSGHSFGAQTTLRVLVADRRVRAGLPLAPPVEALPGLSISDLRVRRPTMVMGGAIDSLTPFALDVRSAYALLRGPRFLIELDDAGHCAFADVCVPMFCGAGCEAGALNGDAAHEPILRWAVPFLLRYVAGRNVGRALRPGGASPPVEVLAAHPRT